MSLPFNPVHCYVDINTCPSLFSSHARQSINLGRSNRNIVNLIAGKTQWCIILGRLIEFFQLFSLYWKLWSFELKSMLAVSCLTSFGEITLPSSVKKSVSRKLYILYVQVMLYVNFVYYIFRSFLRYDSQF